MSSLQTTSHRSLLPLRSKPNQRLTSLQAGMEQILSSAQAQSASTQEIAANAESVAKMSEQMAVLISHFKV